MRRRLWAIVTFVLAFAAPARAACPGKVPNLVLVQWSYYPAEIGPYVHYTWGLPAGGSDGHTSYEVLYLYRGLGSNPAPCFFGGPAVFTTTLNRFVDIPHDFVGPDGDILVSVRVLNCPATESDPAVEYKQPAGASGTPSLSASTTPGSNQVAITYTLPDSRPDAAVLQVAQGAGPFGDLASLSLQCLTSYPQTYYDTGRPAGTYVYRILTAVNYPTAYPSTFYASPTSPAVVTCNLGCATTVPATSPRGQSVAFQSSTSPSSACYTGGPPAFAWTFGDGGTSTLQNPSHAYASTGSFSWNVTVTQPAYDASEGGAPYTCSKGGSISVSAPPPTIPAFTATPSTVVAGNATTLAWSSTDATTASIDHGVGAVGVNGSVPVTPPATLTYTLTVNGPGGTAQKQVSVTVSPPPPMIDAFTATPPSITSGQSSRLAWSSAGGSSASIDNGVGPVPVNGSVDVSPSTTTTYTLTVSGVGGATQQQVTLTVNAPPAPPVITAFTATPPSITSGQSASLAWTSANGTSASIDNGVGPVPVNGSVNVSPTTTTAYTLTVSGAGGTVEEHATLSVTAPPCPVPGAPALSGIPSSFVSGATLALTWSAAAGLEPGGRYVVETSRDGFATARDAGVTRGTSAVIPTDPAATSTPLAVRIRAVQSCASGESISNALALTALAAPPAFVVTRGGPSWVVARGGPPPTATVIFRNVGGQTGQLTFEGSDGFFDVSPSSASVPPGGEISAALTVRGSALLAPGVFTGRLTGTSSLASVSTFVSLTVTPGPPVTGLRARADVSTLMFTSPAGTNPAPRQITIRVSGSAGRPVYLSPSIGPNGAWLTLGSEIREPVGDSGTLTMTVSVDRSLRTGADGIAPFRTLLEITAEGSEADPAVVEVIDALPPSVTPGAGGRDAGADGFVVPVVVRAPGAAPGQVFSSDGWLRNHGSAPLSLDLFLTPDGKNGLTDASVLRSATQIPAGYTLRLSNLVATFFGTEGSGQLEVRAPALHALSIRTTAESVTEGDAASRYGTEIPGVGPAAGIGVGDGELVLPGVDDDAANRANLILAETDGAPAIVRVSVNDASGKTVGSLTRDVPPHGKIQVNRLVGAVSPGASLSGGWASVSVIAGAGRIVAVATVIDNRSGSFSAAVGRGSRATPLLGSGVLSSTTDYLIPSAVRAVGLFNTQFTTNLSLVNGPATPVRLTLTYDYTNLVDGSVGSVAKPLTLAGRGALPKAQGQDVLASLFGLTTPSRGSIRVTGDLAGVVGVAAIAAQVDPADASKGYKDAQVNGTSPRGPSVMAAGELARRFTGAEKSVLKRTNLILLEVAGEACRVEVSASSATGAPLARRTFDVGPGAYFQITDVFGDAGLLLGDGPFQNVELAVRIVSGAGRVLAFATVNDNISRNPEIFVLDLPGPPPDPGIGF